MNNDEERIYMYTDIFTHSVSDEENSDIHKEMEKKKKKKKKGKKSTIFSGDDLNNGENEYSKLRAENSTILNNYFDTEPIKCFNNDAVRNNQNSDIISFPQNKQHSLNVFDGELIKNKHSIRLNKPGFYCIYVENNNNSKWDSIYFGLSKIQVELNYKLIIQNDIKTSEGKSEENRKQMGSKNPEYNDEEVESKEKEENDKNQKRKDSMMMANFDLNDEINKICKYNFDQMDITLEESCEKNVKKNINKYKEKNNNSSDNIIEKNKKHSYLFLDEHKTNIETFICTFNDENQIRVSSKKKKYIYLYNKSTNSTLHLNVSTYMSLGMSIQCRYGLMFCGKYNQIPRDPYSPFRKPVSILSLDGGGILAMSTLIVLKRIENEIRKEIGNDEVKLVDCFDMVCGTSAGGLICLSLLRGINLQDLMNLLPSTMQKIFEGNRNLISGILFEGYDINNVKDLFMERIGSDFMSSLKRAYCFVTATDVKHNPYKLFLLRNYAHKYNAINGESYEGINKFPLWLAAWATASAPTYLKGPSSEDIKNLGFLIKPEIHLVDGALKASNPALIALEECARLNNKNLSSFIKEDLDTLVSIGTGKSPTKLTQSGASGKSASTFEILLNSAHLLTRANETHREVLQWLSGRDNTYFRFNVPNIGDINIDSQDVRDFDIISKATRDYLFDEKFYEIKRLAHKLANNYIRSKYL
ncbi:phospholipase A2 [Plasmodium gonderi]|uniref:Phospholipase A2 n=1 Tax=Plasmodium gonderi TaxID=77519 RepID=A0A1Y1JAJ8_PLAGO|nr:phospholipase A2 [Plasmodium gonderi]GAW79516.1 phospholipase A2 [Plasmodium gonderi]